MDRNIGPLIFSVQPRKSLSARRAWIEIGIIMGGPGMTTLSLSARRAWIEIEITITDIDFRMSLSARRAWIEMPCHSRPPNTPSGRSPQGERG